MTNHYATLRLGMTATAEEIKSAYRRLARLHHPDARQSDGSAFRGIAAAYAVLSDPTARAEYDLGLTGWARSQGYFLCPKCGLANSVPRIPSGHRPVCGECQAVLPVDEATRQSSQREALVGHLAELADTLGTEATGLAKDAVQEVFRRVRKRFGINKRAE